MHHSIRGCDKFGCGHFGAKRGDRTHRGVDLVVTAGNPFESLCAGKVTKLGYVYKGDMKLRYVEVTTDSGHRWRFHYVSPAVSVGSLVKVGDLLGAVQSLQGRYPGITDHVHFEIIDSSGEYLDPTPIVEGD